MGGNARTAPRLPCLVFHWAKHDVWYFIHLEKYILFLIGWCYSRYRNKEWLKLEGDSGDQETLGSTLYLLSFCLWVWPGTACSSMQVSWHFFLLLYLMAWMEPSLTWMRQSFNKKQISWALLPSEVSSPESFLSRSLRMLQSVLTKSIIVSLLFTFLSAPRFLNSSQGCLWLSGRCPTSPSLLVLMSSSRTQLLPWKILSSV